MQREDPVDRILRAAADAADGNSEAFDDGDDRILHNLSRLAALKLAFSRVGNAPAASVAGVPAHWGHLSVLGEIGRGGFGVVYRAFDPVLQREVALKLQRDDGSRPLATGWIEEARRLARVRHPHVLAVHGAGVNDGRVGLWSDLIGGVSLAQWLRNHGRLPRARILHLARQLASALAAIHAADLVHGDIKLENVMIEDGDAVLMDFGAAGNQGTLPRFGTPGSMAPEILDGGRSSTAADMYSLGVLLGCVALDREPRGLLESNLDTRDLRRALGRPLYGLLLRLTDVHPARRPSAAAVLAEIDRIERLPRRRARRLSVALVLASLAVGLGASLLALERTRAERDRSARLKDFLVEGLMQASPLRAQRPASAMEVLEYLDRGLDRRLADIDDARTEMRLVLGEAFLQFGQVERGLAAIETAVAELEAVPSSMRGDLAGAWTSLAVARRRHGDIEGALAAANEAGRVLDLLEEGPEQTNARIRLEVLLGNLFNGLGQPLAALAAHRRTVALRALAVGEDDPQLAVDYNNIGAAALRAGRYREAEAAYRESARRLSAAARDDSGPMAMVQLGLARSLLEQEGSLDRSREHQQAALRLYRANYPDGHPGIWSAEETAARIQLASGDIEGAVAAYRELITRAPDDPAHAAVAQFYLGSALFDLGQMEDARRWFEACAKSSVDTGDPRGIVARAGAAMARWRLGQRDDPPVAELDAAIGTLDGSDFGSRSERALLEAWRASMPPAISSE